MQGTMSPRFVGGIRAAADYLAPGAIEVNKYQPEIFDLVRRRGYLGQRIAHTPATGQPSRFFEQLAIASATFTNPRIIAPTADQPQRVERVILLKAIVGQINYSIFDTEVNQQQGQFSYLEAKDLTDTIDGVLKLHDQNLWIGADTDPMISTSNEYFGISGQIFRAPTIGGISNKFTISSTGSLIDGTKTAVATMVSRTDFQVRPGGNYMNPLFADRFDQEAKTVQMYYNEVEIVPGVIVKALPTQAGLVPIIPDPFITVPTIGGSYQFTEFLLDETAVEYHWLTSPVPRVFQLGLAGNLAAQMVIVKFGAVIVKGANYAHAAVTTVRT